MGFRVSGKASRERRYVVMALHSYGLYSYGFGISGKASREHKYIVMALHSYGRT